MRRALLLVPLAVLACGEKIDPVRTVDLAVLDQAGGAVTWEPQIRTLMEEQCTRCHASTKTGAARQGAPVYLDLDTWAAAAPQASSALAVMRIGYMPPGKRVPDTALALMQAWIDAGTPE